jgi:hypothetical protein
LFASITWIALPTLEPLPLGLQGLDLCHQLGNLVLLLEDQLYQVVAAQRGKRGRQTHGADSTLAGQLLQAANQLRIFERHGLESKANSPRRNKKKGVPFVSCFFCFLCYFFDGFTGSNDLVIH